ncbi:hypothetical protein [Streptomyces sp. B21-101]|uniref:hypothetical protein n=1 Tax=Streptomyces sp. B21-101 TaxID=3039415 RepID=UPI002FF0FB14
MREPLTSEVVRAAVIVITMGCGDVRPVRPGRRDPDRPVTDPEGAPTAVARGIRDEIDVRIGSPHRSPRRRAPEPDCAPRILIDS